MKQMLNCCQNKTSYNGNSKLSQKSYNDEKNDANCENIIEKGVQVSISILNKKKGKKGGQVYSY